MTAYVYELMSADGRLLYVGMTTDPFARIGSHAATKPWRSEIARAIVTPYASRAHALAAETHTIAARAPLYNLDRPSTVGVPFALPSGPFAVWSLPGEPFGPEPEQPAPSPAAVELQAVQTAAEVIRENGSTATPGSVVFGAYADAAAELRVDERLRRTRRGLFAYLRELPGIHASKTNIGIVFRAHSENGLA